MFRYVTCLAQDERGATAIEYALIATLVGVACIAAFQNFSTVTDVLYTLVATVAGGAL